MIELKKLVGLEDEFRVLGKSLIPTGAKVSVVSVLGALGKSTLMNKLLRQNVFTNSKNTTKGIYMFKTGSEVYLDHQGVSETTELATFTSFFSDTILIIAESHSNNFEDSIMPVLFNELLKERTHKSNIVVVVKNHSKQAELSKLKQNFTQKLEKQWNQAIQTLKSIDKEWTRRRFKDECNVYVEFVEFNKDGSCRELRRITEIIRNSPKCEVAKRLEQSINCANANILGKLQATKSQIDQKKQELESKAKELLLSNPLSNEFEQQLEEIHNSVKTPVCEVLSGPFERIKGEYLRKAFLFKLYYMKADIQYYYFKLSLCRVLGTWFGKFSEELRTRKSSFEEKLNRIVGNSRLPEELKNKIKKTINKKKEKFLEVFSKKLHTAKVKTWAGCALSVVTLALGGGLVGSGLVVCGVVTGSIGAALGLGMSSEKYLTVSLKLRREESDLEWEIMNLLSSIKNSKASSAVFEIDDEFKHTFSPLDLENLLIKK